MVIGTLVFSESTLCQVPSLIHYASCLKLVPQHMHVAQKSPLGHICNAYVQVNGTHEITMNKPPNSSHHHHFSIAT